MDGFTYDVFLSFRGTDTRHGFTGNLWKALDDRGIRTFFDKEDIPTGKEITPSLLQAIKQSRMAIVVLSRNYATSSFCLNELAHILDCIKGKGRLVWPVFYDVDPSDVRWLKRTYGEAMDMHEASSKYNTDRMQKLKNALHQVANLSGTHFKNGDKYQYEFIEKIVKEVSREIKPFTLFVADYPVGLKPQREDIISLLNVGSDEEVHMVGIHGIGGIGKTTLALDVYNSIADQFEGSCFLEKVRENSEKHGLTYLQKILLSKTVGEKEIELTSVNEGITVIQQRLRQKKVLLLLDDVDNMEQLNAIVGKPEWLGRESRVIITTRDTGLLTSHGVKSTYEVKELNKEDALKLLRWKAFKSDSVNSSCADILNLLERARTISSSLPLALEVIGSHLFKIGIEEWEYVLDQYEKIPDKTIQKVLEVSFNALEREERSVFLDIACFFKGHKLVEVEKILHAQHGDSAKGLIKVLVEKSLVKISESGNMALHDLIEDMGKEIVRRESPEEPGKRSRLWNPKDIVQVLEENMGTSEIEVIYLDSNIEVNWDGEAFKKTKNLRTLIITGECFFNRRPKYLPNSLKILKWMAYPSSSRLPPEFYPKQLAIFKLDYSEFWFIRRLDFFKKTSKFENMRILNLDNGIFLKEIPNVSGLPNLEELSCQRCFFLKTIDYSVGLLGKLKILRVKYCETLKRIPPLKLASLEELDISNCYSLESFPRVMDGSLDKLKILRANYCKKLRSFPPLELASLEELYLSNCESLESFAPMVRLPCKLKILHVDGCWMLTSFPPLKFASLEEFDLSYCVSLENFPEILRKMENITQLWLVETPVKELPLSFQNLTRLQRLYLSHCGIIRLPSSIVMMSELVELTIVDGGWLFPKQDEGEGKVSSMQSSQVELLHLRICNLSDESLAIGLKWFANVKELDLSGSKFTTLPECIEKCQFLWKLILNECEELREIKGIPPSLKTLFALNCKSLTLSSKSKLLNQKLHETGNTWFCLPGAKIPEWLDHECMQGQSISFWFRNKFPAIALCVVSLFTWGNSGFPIRVIINGSASIYAEGKNSVKLTKTYHIHLFDMKMETLDDNEALLKNKWNHVEIDLGLPFQNSGIHVLKEKSSMEDIRFTNPEDDVNILGLLFETQL